MNKKGFELNISNTKYYCICEMALFQRTRRDETNNKLSLRLNVFKGDSKERVRIDTNSYEAEKIGDFIKNSINGQDTLYWDFNAPNRHFEEDTEYKRAWEIVVEKRVNVGEFEDMLEDWTNITFEDYLAYRVEDGYDIQSEEAFDTKPLTKEDFDLLKEILK